METSLTKTSNVETFFYSLLKGVVSDNVFVGGAPEKVDIKWKDFVVVRCGYISTKDAYARTVVNVELYAKALSDGTKNVAGLTKLEDKLNECVEQSSDEHYRLRIATNLGSFDAASNLYCNIYSIELVIL